jgi:hypothetical protein
VRTGSVISTSSVPDRRSSAHARIVIADTRRMSRSGIHWNSGRTSASPRAKNLACVKNRNRAAARKMVRKMSATGDWNSARSSLRTTTSVERPKGRVTAAPPDA